MTSPQPVETYTATIAGDDRQTILEKADADAAAYFGSDVIYRPVTLAVRHGVSRKYLAHATYERVS